MFRGCQLRRTSLIAAVFCLLVLCGAGEGHSREPADTTIRRFLTNFCQDCHNADDPAGQLNLAGLKLRHLAANPVPWEKVVRKLSTRLMPPADAERPGERSYQRVTSLLESKLDQAAAARPAPGRTAPFRRLTRTEYRNAVRDLLGLDVDVSRLLPADESSQGFDNITVSGLAPTRLKRAVSAAQKIARQAVGATVKAAGGDTFRVPADRTQEGHVAGLPLGTRGGTLIRYAFPRRGSYEIAVRLTRDRNEEVEGLRQSHELVVLVDRREAGRFTVRPPRDGNHSRVDSHLKLRVAVDAGTHAVGITFVKLPNSLIETRRQPYDAHFNRHRHPRQSPAVFQVSITGPYDSAAEPRKALRRKLLTPRPADPTDREEAIACARRILEPLVRRAYRRPAQPQDLVQPLRLFGFGFEAGGFEAGMEHAIAGVLVNPNFLFRIERDPPNVKAGSAYRVSDIALASRLSFFLWSSLPDEPLLAAAVAGKLRSAKQLEQQVRRMLADPRAASLATNFAGQWLHLRNLDSVQPNLRLFPDFDDNLRQAFRRETELFVASVWREDRSVLDLLSTDDTFLNERLARHYGVPHVYGSRFRRVKLDPASHRGGLLRQGSILTVTSYATRTSPVIRGHWIMDNLLGAAPPPPPPNVPALKDNTVAADLTVRQRLAAHRANPACASCHQQMDPVGFTLENFDAVGRWRDVELGRPVDASGGFPGGGRFVGVAGLEAALRKRPELFARNLAEKLLTFALGRVVEPTDGPAIRQAVRRAAQDNYQFSALVQGIVASAPFQMRRAR